MRPRRKQTRNSARALFGRSCVAASSARSRAQWSSYRLVSAPEAPYLELPLLSQKPESRQYAHLMRSQCRKPLFCLLLSWVFVLLRNPNHARAQSKQLFVTLPPAQGQGVPCNDLRNAGYEEVVVSYFWIKHQERPEDVGSVALRTCDGKTTLGRASMRFAEEIRMEGTGRLLNGKMLNLGGCNCGDGTNTFNCFIDITHNREAPFGYGVNNLPLIPFTSIANNDARRKIGSVLYAPSFDGVVLPNGLRHDGCMRKIDHIGRGAKGTSHIDFFAVTEHLAYGLFMTAVRKSKIRVHWDAARCRNSSLSYGVSPDDI